MQKNLPGRLALIWAIAGLLGIIAADRAVARVDEHDDKNVVHSGYHTYKAPYVTISGYLVVDSTSGNFTVVGNLIVTGTATVDTLAGTSVTVTGYMVVDTISGNTNVTGNLVVGGTSTLTGNVAVTGTATVDTLAGTSVTVTGALTASGLITADSLVVADFSGLLVTDTQPDTVSLPGVVTTDRVSACFGDTLATLQAYTITNGAVFIWSPAAGETTNPHTIHWGVDRPK